MLTLARKAGFQGLLRVWDADKNWVFVQEFDSEWECVDEAISGPPLQSQQTAFSEEKLREIVFQVVALVHFLHAHGLSLAGELWHHDLMVRTLRYLAIYCDDFFSDRPKNMGGCR